MAKGKKNKVLEHLNLKKNEELKEKVKDLSKKLKKSDQAQKNMQEDILDLEKRQDGFVSYRNLQEEQFHRFKKRLARMERIQAADIPREEHAMADSSPDLSRRNSCKPEFDISEAKRLQKVFSVTQYGNRSSSVNKSKKGFFI